MIYRVRHTSTLSYAAPVTQAQFTLRLVPWPWPGQTLQDCRLRITPTPLHDRALIEQLAEALVETWDHLGLARGTVETVETKPKSLFAVSGG